MRLDAIRDLLKNSNVLPEEHRSELLKLLWLMSQASDDSKWRAEQALLPFLDREDMTFERFMKFVRREIRVLESSLGASR